MLHIRAKPYNRAQKLEMKSALGLPLDYLKKTNGPNLSRTMALALPFNLNKLPFINRQEQTCLLPPATVVEQLKHI